jgi:hypothetical protein
MRNWYQSSWKRFSKSLGDTFLEDVQKSLRKLEVFTDRIKTEEGRKNTEVIIQGMMRVGYFMQEALVNQEKKYKAHLDRHLDRYLDQIREEQRNGPVTTARSVDMSANVTTLIALPKKAEDSVTRLSNALTVRDLQGKIQSLFGDPQDPNLIARLVDESQYNNIGPEISTKIQEWSTSLTADGLWIEGPYGTEWPSRATLTSAFVLGTLQRLQLSTLVYFFKYDASQYKTFSPDKELVNLVHSLIYQASQNLSKAFPDPQHEISISAAQIDQLNGEIESLPAAIEILKELILAGQVLQFCIIDGMQVLEGKRLSKAGAQYLEQLLSKLCNISSSVASKGKMMKILFTTDGMMNAFAKAAKNGLLLRLQPEMDEEDESSTLDLSSLTEE